MNFKLDKDNIAKKAAQKVNEIIVKHNKSVMDFDQNQFAIILDCFVPGITFAISIMNSEGQKPLEV